MDIKANLLFQEMQQMATQTRTEMTPEQALQINPSKENFSNMLQDAGGYCQNSSINSEDALSNPIRRAVLLRVRRSRASVFN